MTVATALTEVQVGLSQVEVAQQQVEDEEKQRVLGFIPNFYVSYDSPSCSSYFETEIRARLENYDRSRQLRD